jgi:Lrp/AsnC family leucine-responsive transcriptional regulator|tara:strand:+ start:7 stop:462 length:456 start_codon:yes stop_codon:yes gene_type:complete
MDKIDKKIVFELQKNGRLSNFDLAEKVGLSPSPCLRRIKNLEKKKIISGYTAIIDEELFGYPITAFVSVRLENQTDGTLKVFEEGISHLDEVVDCWLVTGNRDYLLRVVAINLKTYEKFMREDLTKIKGIASIETNFALGSVKTKQPLPIK